MIHPWEYFKKRKFFHGWDERSGFNLSTLRNRFQHFLLLKFHHALNIFIKLLFSALVHFDSVLLEESKIYCSSQRFILRQILKRSNFFTDETEKLVLTCLRWETSSNIYYYWSFTMHSKSSSIFFLRSWCTSAPFYSKSALYSVHLSDSSIGDNLKKSKILTGETEKVVLTCLRLETDSNIYYFWSFTMHSIPSSFFLQPWCNSAPFYSKRALYSVHLSDSSMGFFLKRSIFFHSWHQKKILTCLRLETDSNIYYFWSFTMHSIISSNFFLRPWCNSTPF